LAVGVAMKRAETERKRVERGVLGIYWRYSFAIGEWIFRVQGVITEKALVSQLQPTRLSRTIEGRSIIQYCICSS
jgi:hypothetical protein